MPLVNCPKCLKDLRLADNLAGKTIKCPACQTAIRIPGSNAAAPPPARDSKPARPAPVVAPVDDEAGEVVVADPVKVTKAAAKRSGVGILLVAIGTWITVGALAIMLIFLILTWCRVQPTSERGLLVGLPGVIAWITAAVGIVFLTTGVQRGASFGLSIALCCVAGVHLLLLIAILITAGSGSSSPFGTGMPHGTGMQPRLPSFGSFRESTTPWSQLGTALPYVPLLPDNFTAEMRRYAQPALQAVYQSPAVADGTVGVLGLIGGFLEAARFMVLALCIHTLVRKRFGNGFRDMSVALPVALIVLMVVNLVLGLTLNLANRGAWHAMFGMQLLTLLALIGIYSWAAAMMTGARREV